VTEVRFLWTERSFLSRTNLFKHKDREGHR